MKLSDLKRLLDNAKYKTELKAGMLVVNGQVMWHLAQTLKTYNRGKRDLLQVQKRPTTEAKETYYRGKGDLP